MTHKHLLLGLSALVSMAMPASAFALYVDPYDAQAGGGFPFQYNARHAQDAVDYQNWVYEQRRVTTDVPTTYPRVVYQPSPLRGTVLPDGVRTDDPTDRTDGDIDPTVARRIESPIIRTVFRDVVPAHLPQTGPETVLGGLALLAAAGFTLWKSRSKEQLA